MLELRDFQAVCRDTLTCALAMQVYADLLTDERLSNIKPQFDEEAAVFYLSAMKDQILPVAFIPVLHTKEIDFRTLEAIQEKLDSDIMLTIVDNTANILYYEVSSGVDGKNEKANK